MICSFENEVKIRHETKKKNFIRNILDILIFLINLLLFFLVVNTFDDKIK